MDDSDVRQVQPVAHCPSATAWNPPSATSVLYRGTLEGPP